jgi:uncharacterized membrane protein
MNTIIWVVQALLALIFAMTGSIKSTQPDDILVKTVTWADRFPLKFVRFTGVAELLGAIGLIFPWALNIAPVLTPLAAAGLLFMQLLALIHHALNKEGIALALNLFLMAMAAFVAHFRFIMLQL